MKRTTCVLLALVALTVVWARPALPRTVVRVAAIQTESVPGAIAENLEHAAVLVAGAAEAGADLVLLPELMPSGYTVSKDIWSAAEPSDGSTVAWLQETSQSLGVWLGTSFVEAAGEDFFNTFVLCAPDGTIAGRVRKQRPAAHETFFTKGEVCPHTIETPLGKIGVVICFEATLCEMMRQMHSEAVDLVLMPTADPVPESEKDKGSGEWEHDLTETARLYSVRLGVPAVLANQGGAWTTTLPGLLPDQNSIYRGQSAIADADGTLKAFLGQDEGVIVADVVLDPAMKVAETPPCSGQYCKDMPLSSRVYQVAVEALGRLWYGLSIERRQKALEISSGKQQSGF